MNHFKQALLKKDVSGWCSYMAATLHDRALICFWMAQ